VSACITFGGIADRCSLPTCSTASGIRRDLVHLGGERMMEAHGRSRRNHPSRSHSFRELGESGVGAVVMDVAVQLPISCPLKGASAMTRDGTTERPAVGHRDGEMMDRSNVAKILVMIRGVLP
jgi:hypothetical protein